MRPPRKPRGVVALAIGLSLPAAAWEPLWRRVGLDRLQHRVDEVAVEDDALVVRARVAPAGTDLGVSATYRWSAVPGGPARGAPGPKTHTQNYPFCAGCDFG